MTDTDKKAPMRKPATTTKPDADTTAPSAAPADDAQAANNQIHEDLVDLSVEADKIVKRNLLWAMGAGAAPLPIAEMFTIGAVQLKLMKELSDHYNVPFSKNLAKSAAFAIIGGLGPVELTKCVVPSLIKLVPGAGTAFGIATLPVAAGALTYVIGQVLVKHFESGGTFLDFNASKMKDASKALYAKGKGIVGNMRKNKGEAADGADPSAVPA